MKKNILINVYVLIKTKVLYILKLITPKRIHIFFKWFLSHPSWTGIGVVVAVIGLFITINTKPTLNSNEPQKKIVENDKNEIINKVATLVAPASKDEYLILVSNFDTKKTYKTHLSDFISSKIRSSTTNSDSIRVERIPINITENNGGKQLARKIGEKTNASIIIWGWAIEGETTETPLSLNFEIINKLPSMPGLCPQAYGKVQVVSNESLTNFSIQSDLSDQMSTFTLLTLAMFEFNNGHNDEGLNYINQALDKIKKGTTSVDAGTVYLLRGDAHYDLKKYKLAINDYVNVIKTESRYNDLVSLKIGMSLYGLGLYKESLEKIKNINNSKYTLSSNFFLFLNSIAIDDSDGIVKYSNELLKNRPSISIEYALAYESELENHDHWRIIKKYEDIISNNDSILADYILAYFYEQTNQIQKASNKYKKIITGGYASEPAHYHYAMILSDEKKPEQSIEYFTRAIKTNPDRACSYGMRGNLYYDQGQNLKGLADWETFADLKSEKDIDELVSRLRQDKWKWELKEKWNNIWK